MGERAAGLLPLLVLACAYTLYVMQESHAVARESQQLAKHSDHVYASWRLAYPLACQGSRHSVEAELLSQSLPVWLAC